MPVVFVRLLRTWYSQLTGSIRWNSRLSDVLYIMWCKTRQHVITVSLRCLHQWLGCRSQAVWFWYTHWPAVCLVFFYLLMTLRYCQHHVMLCKRWLISAGWEDGRYYIEFPEKPSYNVLMEPNELYYYYDRHTCIMGKRVKYLSVFFYCKIN